MIRIQFLSRPGKASLAYAYTEPAPDHKNKPLLVFLGGYRSDMTGTKATWLEQRCKLAGLGFLRFDYSGHGQSEGRFGDGTIGSWKEDALGILDAFAGKSFLLIGSSMGGWIALLAALDRPEQVAGLVGIAAAPDFTDDMYGQLDNDQRAALEENGFVDIPGEAGTQPYHFTKLFYEEAKNHRLLNESRPVDFPVRLLQGKEDLSVPWQTAEKIKRVFKGDVKINYIEDGDHRLSRLQDLELLGREIRQLLALNESSYKT